MKMEEEKKSCSMCSRPFDNVKYVISFDSYERSVHLSYRANAIRHTLARCRKIFFVRWGLYVVRSFVRNRA